jgi:hypothetical protein
MHEDFALSIEVKVKFRLPEKGLGYLVHLQPLLQV